MPSSPASLWPCCYFLSCSFGRRQRLRHFLYGVSYNRPHLCGAGDAGDRACTPRATGPPGTASSFAFEVTWKERAFAGRWTSTGWCDGRHRAGSGRGCTGPPCRGVLLGAGCGRRFFCSAPGTAQNRPPWALGCLWEGSGALARIRPSLQRDFLSFTASIGFLHKTPHGSRAGAAGTG